MGKLTATKLQSLIKGDAGRFSDGNGLFFWVRPPYSPTWKLRYSFQGKRKELTLGKYPEVSLADARMKAELEKKLLREGTDPLIIKKRKEKKKVITVQDLFDDWHKNDLQPRIKTHHIQRQVFNTYISPYIGSTSISDVTPRDVREVIQSITNKGYKTVSNDALGHMKQLFNHGIKLDLLRSNPASAFGISDAGGIEKSKRRSLSLEELQHVFIVFQENIESFTRDNYLACALLLSLAVRKSELCQAPWCEIDFEQHIWNIPKERSKTGVAITIPLSEEAIEWFKELKIRSFGSDYVFPNRSRSKNPYMGNDTLNRAISKLFGRETGREVQPPNKMGNIAHFSVHDLRRSSRSLMARVGVPGHIAERCLNHAIRGVEGIYDRYDYFDERKEALEKVIKILVPIINKD